MDQTLFDSLRLELERLLTVAVLAQLHSEHYGYTLRKALANLGLDNWMMRRLMIETIKQRPRLQQRRLHGPAGSR